MQNSKSTENGLVRQVFFSLSNKELSIHELNELLEWYKKQPKKPI